MLSISRRLPCRLADIPLLITPLLVFAVITSTSHADELPTAKALLDKAIEYHDPDGKWLSGTFYLEVETRYADGRSRTRKVLLAEQGGRLEQTREHEGHQVATTVADDDCTISIDGRAPRPGELEKLELGCDRAKRMRNYLAYLWGLPMKLHDPGTHLGPEVERTTFQGRETLRLGVTYDPEVGTDRWYFFFDPESWAMVGYSFYKDEAETKGEYIILSDELVLGPLRLPRNRAWYKVPGDEYLGTDRLIAIERR